MKNINVLKRYIQFRIDVIDQISQIKTVTTLQQRDWSIKKNTFEDILSVVNHLSDEEVDNIVKR